MWITAIFALLSGVITCCILRSHYKTNENFKKGFRKALEFNENYKETFNFGVSVIVIFINAAWLLIYIIASGNAGSKNFYAQLLLFIFLALFGFMYFISDSGEKIFVSAVITLCAISMLTVGISNSLKPIIGVPDSLSIGISNNAKKFWDVKMSLQNLLKLNEAKIINKPSFSNHKLIYEIQGWDNNDGALIIDPSGIGEPKLIVSKYSSNQLRNIHGEFFRNIRYLKIVTNDNDDVFLLYAVSKQPRLIEKPILCKYILVNMFTGESKKYLPKDLEKIILS